MSRVKANVKLGFGELVNIESLKKGDVALLGICSDINSSFLRGTKQAPAVIRDTLKHGSANLFSELGIDIGSSGLFKDLGDKDIAEDKESFLNISNDITPILDAGVKPMLLGGDHAITYPIIKAFYEKYGAINILHFDAHPDLYHEFKGNPYSHACPFARIMEQGLAKRLVQVGIRTLNKHQQDQAEKYGVEIHQMHGVAGKSFNANDLKLEFDGPVYISFDIDALDPAFAPGVSHFEPGGLSVRDVLTIIQSIKAPIIGADIVEFNPARDINGMTAMVAVKLLKEIVGKMLS